LKCLTIALATGPRAADISEGPLLSGQAVAFIYGFK
jgi:hypothetical protein